MRPPPFFDKILGVFDSEDAFIKALGGDYSDKAKTEIRRLIGLGLPPILDYETLGLLIGYNAGFVFSVVTSEQRNYRIFEIPKGDIKREIQAPRVGLKSIQKWLSLSLSETLKFPDHVYGFVPNKSHIDAAYQHRNANWIVSIDVKDCFRSTPKASVTWAFKHIGYNPECAQFLSTICCYKGALAQGSPVSPLILNIAMRKIDGQLSRAIQRGFTVTRYADDISISSSDAPPEKPEDFKALIKAPWSVNEEKFHFSLAPRRLKVNGFTVGGGEIRLTKGYRNRLRMIRHILAGDVDSITECKLSNFRGHLAYSDHVRRRLEQLGHVHRD